MTAYACGICSELAALAAAALAIAGFVISGFGGGAAFGAIGCGGSCETRTCCTGPLYEYFVFSTLRTLFNFVSVTALYGPICNLYVDVMSIGPKGLNAGTFVAAEGSLGMGYCLYGAFST